MTGRRLAGAVRAHAGVDDLEEVDRLHLLQPGRRPHPSRPLAILVHPGDYEDNPSAMTRAAAALADMVADDPDVLVVHRISCALAHLTPGFARAVSQVATPGGPARVLYDPGLAGSLDEVAADALAHLRAAERPSIRLLGAYADPDHGCVTAVWQGLLARGVARDRVRVDPMCLTGGRVRATPDGPRPGLMATGN